MKRFSHILLCTIALFVCAVACNKESLEELVDKSEAAGRITLDVGSDNPLLIMNEEGSAGEINFKSRGGEITLDIITNQEGWSYTATEADWLTITADKHFLHIATERNIGDSSKSATLVVTASGKGGGDRHLSHLISHRTTAEYPRSASLKTNFD